jgi:NAD(P)-dependent dehydrogenase (short-subunit alcohol dehydrogenase family)
MNGLPAPPPEGASALPAGSYEGRVALVTGGGTGLGLAIAVEFARLGAVVAIASRDPDHREAGLRAIAAVGPPGIGVPLDVREPVAIEASFNLVQDTVGPVDILVNNAAGNFPVPAEDLSPGGWRAVTSIVLDGTFYMSREFARRAIAAEREGVILNVGASYAWTGGPGFAHSAAAKAGVKNLTESLAVEWAPYGIRVNGLVPGLMPHDEEVAAIRGVPGRGDAAREQVSSPALRVGERRELGWAATFLCSPYAAYVTGHTMVVDGANWQRRALLREPFTPIREQLGRPPFSLD